MIIKRIGKMILRAWLITIAFCVPSIFGLYLADLAARYQLEFIALFLGIGGFVTGAAICFSLWDEWTDKELWP